MVKNNIVGLYKLHVCACVCVCQLKSWIMTSFLPVDTLRHTVEQLTIHRSMNVVIIAEINVIFITVLSLLSRSYVRDKRCLLAVKCVKKSKVAPNEAEAL